MTCTQGSAHFQFKFWCITHIFLYKPGRKLKYIYDTHANKKAIKYRVYYQLSHFKSWSKSLIWRDTLTSISMSKIFKFDTPWRETSKKSSLLQSTEANSKICDYNKSRPWITKSKTSMVWLNKIVHQVWLVFTSRHTFSKNLLPFDPPLLYRTSSSFHWQLLK